MAESEAGDWVFVWVKNFHRRARSKRFWQEDQERRYLGTSFHALSILTILLDRFQTKSFEDMNVLIKKILKLCTTKQLFTYLFKTEKSKIFPSRIAPLKLITIRLTSQ